MRLRPLIPCPSALCPCSSVPAPSVPQPLGFCPLGPSAATAPSVPQILGPCPLGTSVPSLLAPRSMPRRPHDPPASQPLPFGTYPYSSALAPSPRLLPLLFGPCPCPLASALQLFDPCSSAPAPRLLSLGPCPSAHGPRPLPFGPSPTQLWPVGSSASRSLSLGLSAPAPRFLDPCSLGPLARTPSCISG
ncbi:putative proline-rich protein 21 [Scylla paramamosain]|uniref:putative proline-rich protein 21 n=1 Tax=Scylla paramamosain TaxID=85552 RepID=UPI0030828856